MSGENTVATLDGLFKQVYADKLADVRPDGTILIKRVNFASASKDLGSSYNQMVMLTHEHGFTCGGTTGAAFALESQVNGTSGNAQVYSAELVLKSAISVAAASRAAKEGVGAFTSATKLLVENMFKSFIKRLECTLFYGQVGLGLISNVSTNALTIAAYDWAPGVFAAAEGMPVQIYRPSGSNLFNSSITTTTISSVDMINHIVNVAAAGSTAQNDIIAFKGAATAGATPTLLEAAGLHKMLSTTSGTLFGINVASYSLWQASSVNVGTDATTNAAVLSFAKVGEAVQRAMEKGLVEEKVVLICSPGSWENLMEEQQSKQSYDSSYDPKAFNAGADSVKIRVNGIMVEVVSSIYCRAGFAYLLPIEDFVRIGSSDITFNQPGFEKDRFFKLLEGYNGYELRAYSDQALFTSRPGCCVLLQYIKD